MVEKKAWLPEAAQGENRSLSAGRLSCLKCRLVPRLQQVGTLPILPCLYIISYARSLKVKSLAVQDIINRWKALNKILADEVIGRLSKVEYALPNGAMSDLRHLLAESQRLQNQAVRPLQSAVTDPAVISGIRQNEYNDSLRLQIPVFYDGQLYNLQPTASNM